MIVGSALWPGCVTFRPNAYHIWGIKAEELRRTSTVWPLLHEGQHTPPWRDAPLSPLPRLRRRGLSDPWRACVGAETSGSALWERAWNMHTQKALHA